MCDEKNFDPKRMHHHVPYGQFCFSPNDIFTQKVLAIGLIC